MSRTGSGPAIPGVAGDIVARGEEGYETAREASVWALNVPDRRPDLIVRARGAADVLATVRHAAERGTTVAVKSSGHNYAASFLREGGILLDVAALDHARVLDDGVTAHAGPGIRSAALARTLAARGRAFPTGHHATVGIGGFLLGGGMGFNGRAWGELACFEVEAVDVVTAAGEALTVDADAHPDLLWAARGAGMAFPAVATGFRLRTRPHPDGMHASRWAYPLAAAAEVAGWLQAHADAGELGVERFVSFEPATGLCRIVAIAFAVDPGEARAALGALAAAAPAGARTADGPAPLDDERLYAGGITGAVLRTVNDTAWTEDPVAAAAILAERVAVAPDPRSIAMADHRAAPELPVDAAASVAARGFLSWGAKWSDPARDEANRAWVRETAAALAPHRTGRYLNESDVVGRADRAADCFSPAAWARLAAVRAAWDPDGRFPAPW